MKKLIPVAFALIALCYSCQKAGESATNTIEFDTNGQHHVYSVSQSQFLMDTFQDKFNKSANFIAGSPIAGGVGLLLTESNSTEKGSCLSTTDYKSFDVNSYNLPCGISDKCPLFNVIYIDNSGVNFSAHTDTTVANTDFLTIATCIGSPPVLTGSFRVRLYSQDSVYNSMPVFTATNGKFSLTYNAP